MNSIEQLDQGKYSRKYSGIEVNDPKLALLKFIRLFSNLQESVEIIVRIHWTFVAAKYSCLYGEAAKATPSLKAL